ncbi:MAG: hypothetical protein KA758_04590 [Acidimicrobiales bacterium]|nr:hypothetical protein [Acidimicrobiales bacterium]HMS87256.1 hypothetical protein [Acidimicrobiales bacterium]
MSISLLTPPDRVTVEGVGSKPWHAKVLQRSSLSPREARMLVTTATRGAHLVVADQISAGAKEYLASVPSWGWLDRRSELRLRHGSADLEIRLSPTFDESPPGGVRLAAPASDGPIRGRAGISYAAALLLGDPAGPPSIRSIARRVGMAASTLSDAAGLLRDAGLILPSGEAALPDLFWALAAVWRPLRASPVASIPDPVAFERQSPNVDDLSTQGWAQGGDQAALAWGAPMFALGTVPWIWVPDQITARRVERTLGAATWDDQAAVILVPPTPLACMDRQDPPSGSLNWPTLHPLYLALDLAQDRARGHEILEGWTPPIPSPRPWAAQA